MLACPPATMVAETASIVVGGRPKHSNRLIHYNKYCYVLVLVLMDHNMVFGYGYCWWQNWQWYQHVPPPLVILMAMAVRCCDTKRIAQCSMSRATPEATGCCHQAATHSVLPQRLPGQQANKQQSTNTPKKVAMFMAAAVHQYNTARTLPDGKGPGLY